MGRKPHLLQWYDVTDPRLWNTHDNVSQRFTHGPHATRCVDDLVENFLSDLEKPEALTPLVAAQ